MLTIDDRKLLFNNSLSVRPELVLYDGQINVKLENEAGGFSRKAQLKRRTRPVADYYVSRGGVLIDRNKWLFIAGPAIRRLQKTMQGFPPQNPL